MFRRTRRPLRSRPRQRGQRVRAFLFLLLWLTACGDGKEPKGTPPSVALRPVGQVKADRLPPPDDEEQLVSAHHLITVTGDIELARSKLQGIIDRGTARRAARARAALRLAELKEMAGERRAALGHLEQAKEVAGPGHPLSLEADDRRARILTATPLADVRGPVPGSVVPKHEPPQVVAGFRRAEQLLTRYHRLVVAPQLESINEVLRTKRRALTVAATAYHKVASSANGPAKAAAFYRMAAMYHHMAEALAFAIPPELLPARAHQLRRQLKAESTAYLRKALGLYRRVTKLSPGPAMSPWRELAEREAKTLALVFKPTTRKRSR
jgi:hypothetical protein